MISDKDEDRNYFSHIRKSNFLIGSLQGTLYGTLKYKRDAFFTSVQCYCLKMSVIAEIGWAILGIYKQGSCYCSNSYWKKVWHLLVSMENLLKMYITVENGCVKDGSYEEIQSYKKNWNIRATRLSCFNVKPIALFFLKKLISLVRLKVISSLC